jgi:hypothetical protein
MSARKSVVAAWAAAALSARAQAPKARGRRIGLRMMDPDRECAKNAAVF